MTTMTTAWRRLVPTRAAQRGAPQTVLDIGTSKICCYIARARPGRGFAVLGRGYQLADGLKAGEIIDADAAEASIQAVLHEAEQQSGETVRGVVAAIGAGRLRSRLIKVDRPLHGRKVADDDIRRVLERAREEVSDPGNAVLHVVPVEIAVDGGRPLKDPRGLAGQTLEVLVHLVLADIQPVSNIVACLERCHLEVKGLIAAPYAAGLGVLTEDEMEQGCLVVDLGAGATQIAHFVGGRLAYLDQIQKGGAKISGDLAYGLKTSQREAERLVGLYGGVLMRSCDDNVRIEVPLVGDRDGLPTGEVPRTRLTFIIRSRVEDILEALMARLGGARDLMKARPPKSVVLTGGASQIEGMDELAEETFGLPARLGRPRSVHLHEADEEDPCCAVAAGMLALATGGDDGLLWSASADRRRLAQGLMRCREWFRQNF
jgi:cell division protein FtsA